MKRATTSHICDREATSSLTSMCTRQETVQVPVDQFGSVVRHVGSALDDVEAAVMCPNKYRVMRFGVTEGIVVRCCQRGVDVGKCGAGWHCFHRRCRGSFPRRPLSECEPVTHCHRHGVALCGRLTGCAAGEIEVIRRWADRGLTWRGTADCAVGVEVLVENGLEVFQRGAVAGEIVADVRDEVALAVEAPDREGLAADHLPCEIVASASDLDRAYGYVGAGGDGDPALFHGRAQRAATGDVEEVVVAGLNEGGGAVDRYGCWRCRRRWSDVAVAIEVLAKDGLEILQRGAVTGEIVADVRDEIALAVEAPDREGRAALPGEVVAAGDLHRVVGDERAGCDRDAALFHGRA